MTSHSVTSFAKEDLLEYLSENGVGVHRGAFVPDLLPPAGVQTSVVMVLESPHANELASRLPVSGKAGRDALSFLIDEGAAASALGPFVREFNFNTDGDGIAIVNVSRVPLERTAFDYPATTPELPREAWEMLDRLRKSAPQDVRAIRDAMRREVAQLLLGSFEKRMTSLCLSCAATVVLAGKFAQLYWSSLGVKPAARSLNVPHPSYGQWSPTAASADASLTELRRVFLALTGY